MPRPKKTKLKRCYLCAQRVPVKAFSKYGYDILQCKSCQLFSLKFQKNYQDFVHEYYNEEFFTGSDNRIGYSDYEGDSWPEKTNMRRYLSRIKKFKKSGKLLDGGCATGLFMDIAKDSGFDVSGFDVSAYAVKIARKKFGNHVKRATVSSAKFPPNSFDVITLFDVIEHLEDPKKDLIHLGKMLKSDGLLMINTGDASSLLARIQGKHWHFFVPPQHLFFFSRKTITQLLEQAGYKVVKIDFKGKWVSLRYFLNLYRQIHESKVANFAYSLVANNTVGKLPLYLNLFDNMVVYAQKSKAKK